MLVIQVKVKPNARIAELSEMPDGTWTAQIKSPPVDSRANEKLVTLVTDHVNVGESQAAVKNGASGRMKQIRIQEG